MSILQKAARVKNPPLTSTEAARALRQFTLGPDMATITALTDTRLEAYWNAQMALDAPTPGGGSKQTAYNMALEQGPTPGVKGGSSGWALGITGRQYALQYRQFVHPDHVRTRVAYALSEYFSVGETDAASIGAPWLANLYDIYCSWPDVTAFQMLKRITLTPEMAMYLSYLFNARELGARFPDQNYAREIMQLFTIGLWELKIDGTRMKKRELAANDPRYIALGSPGAEDDVPTYTQDDIYQMSRVFTGLMTQQLENGPPGTGSFITQWDGVRTPLVMDDAVHETDRSKQVFKLTSSPDTYRIDIPAGTGGNATLDTALTALVNHPSMAPFFAKRMINLLVTSNPPPEYVARVASVFRNDGTGQVGNLRAVFKAIFFDQVARAPSSRRLIERTADIYERACALPRATPRFTDTVGNLLATSAGGGVNGRLAYPTGAYTLFGNPSVFGRWLAAYSPAGEMFDAALVAPELSQYDANGCTAAFTLSGSSGVRTYQAAEARATQDETDLAGDATAIGAVFDRAALVYASGNVPAYFRTIVVNRVVGLNRTTLTNRRIAMIELLSMLLNTPYATVRI